MKKQALQVSLRVHQPSAIELTIGDKVQLDQLRPSPHGYLAERRGDLLNPGTNTLHLDQGVYFFKTLSDARLKVVHGGVDTTTNVDDKNGNWPEPKRLVDGAPEELPAKGSKPDGEAPQLTIE